MVCMFGFEGPQDLSLIGAVFGEEVARGVSRCQETMVGSTAPKDGKSDDLEAMTRLA